ncbi:MAG: ABC transporter ATP-binding protein [Deltaproteobacteria bacterium]|nr:MAG: ABC transporter ATP-binding protein [Deltaproteobacteria bacterium]
MRERLADLAGPLARFYRGYVRRNVPSYVAGAVALVATNYAVVRIPKLAGEAVDLLGAGDRAAIAAARTTAWELVVLGVGIVLVRTLSRILFFNPARRVEYRVGVDVFAHLLAMPRTFLGRQNVGELVSLATNDATALRLLAGFASLQICNVAIAIPMHVVQMWRTHPQLTLACLVPVTLGALYMRHTIRRFYALVRRGMEFLARLSDRVLECYAGVGAIRVLGAERAALARFDERNDAYLDLQLRVASMRAFAMPVLGFSGLVGTAVVLWWGGRKVMAGELSVGDLVAFSALLLSLVSVLTSLAWVLASMSRGMASLRRIDALLGEPEVDEQRGEALVLSAPPSLSVRDLTFAYDETEPVLCGVSFDVPRGGTVGIVGSTGAGKTTLLSLIARVLEPPERTIFVDGRDVKSVRLADWRRAVAYVPQQPFLFSATIRDNILFGLPPEVDPASPEAARRLDRVIRLAALEDDLAAMPEGLDTVVGERGIMLSGGQRQRIALARALVRNAPILLLDDVLSAVDQGTEARLVEAIAGLHGASTAEAPTTVVVSHRTSVLEHADHIVVLDGGRVVEAGSHDELVRAGGLYAAIRAEQGRGEGSER